MQQRAGLRGFLMSGGIGAVASATGLSRQVASVFSQGSEGCALRKVARGR